MEDILDNTTYEWSFLTTSIIYLLKPPRDKDCCFTIIFALLKECLSTLSFPVFIAGCSNSYVSFTAELSWETLPANSLRSTASTSPSTPDADAVAGGDTTHCSVFAGACPSQKPSVLLHTPLWLRWNIFKNSTEFSRKYSWTLLECQISPFESYFIYFVRLNLLNSQTLRMFYSQQFHYLQEYFLYHHGRPPSFFWASSYPANFQTSQNVSCIAGCFSSHSAARWTLKTRSTIEPHPLRYCMQ